MTTFTATIKKLGRRLRRRLTRFAWRSAGLSVASITASAILDHVFGIEAVPLQYAFFGFLFLCLSFDLSLLLDIYSSCLAGHCY